MTGMSARTIFISQNQTILQAHRHQQHCSCRLCKFTKTNFPSQTIEGHWTSHTGSNLWSCVTLSSHKSHDKHFLSNSRCWIERSLIRKVLISCKTLKIKVFAKLKTLRASAVDQNEPKRIKKVKILYFLVFIGVFEPASSVNQEIGTIYCLLFCNGSERSKSLFCMELKPLDAA